MKITIGQILDEKGHEVWQVAPDTSVFEALELMAKRGIGAVLVMDEDRITGIFSERDYARKVILKDRSSKDTPVADIMTHSVYYVPPWRTVDECMALMTARRIRHLPVIEEGMLRGLVSIGDVVKAIISEQEFVIHELEAFADEALREPHKKLQKTHGVIQGKAPGQANVVGPGPLPDRMLR